MKLDPWQEEVLEYNGNILLCTGRQVGKTTVFAHKIAKFMLDHPKSQTIVVSNTEDQAQLIIIMIVDYLEKHHKNDIAKGKNKPTKSKIQLKNKAKVISRPVGNTGDAVRGFTGDVLYIDEAAMMPEMMWAAAKPTLASTGGQIWMSSTPKGKKGYFYECYLNKHNRYKVVETNTIKVYKEREESETWTPQRKKLALEFLEEEKKSMSSLEFGQEYEGKFLEDLQQLFADELIHRCMTQERRPYHLPQYSYYMGCDIARQGDDETTYEIFHKSHDVLFQIDNIVTKKQTLTATAQKIMQLDMQYHFNKVYVDDNGIGAGVLDILLAEEKIKRRIEGLNNAKKLIDYRENRKKRLGKEDLYLNLLHLMESGRIHFLKDDSLFLSLKSVQFETKEEKGKGTVRIFGNYTHIAEGIIRAAWCMKNKNLNMGITYV